MFAPPSSQTGDLPQPWLIGLKRSTSIPGILPSSAAQQQQQSSPSNAFLTSTTSTFSATTSPSHHQHGNANNASAASFNIPSPSVSRSNSLSNIIINSFLPPSPLLPHNNSENDLFLRHSSSSASLSSPLMGFGMGSSSGFEQPPPLFRANSAGHLARALSLLQMGINLDETIRPTSRTTSSNQMMTTNINGTTSSELERIRAILGMAWSGKEQLQRPPRDMKRFRSDDRYVVCEVLTRNDSPALLMRSLTNPETDFGLYKPPVKFNNYPFRVGDLVGLREVGYTASRNKIAMDISIQPSGLVTYITAPRGPVLHAPPLVSKSSNSSIGSIDDAKELVKLKLSDRRSSSESSSGKANHMVDAGAQRVTEIPVVTVNDVSALGILDDHELAEKVEAAVGMPWTVALGKKPPCDMKRLALNAYYVIVKVTRWGEATALCLRSVDQPKSDFGFFKPPANYAEYPFRVGDCIQVTRLGYSPLRNKIASEIRITQTSFMGRAGSSSSSSSSVDGNESDDTEQKLQHVREINRVRQRIYRAEKRARLAGAGS